MRHINKIMKKEGLDHIYLYDKPSNKGFPTKNSIVLNIVFEDIPNTKTTKFGFSIKVPGDEFIERIGKATAYRMYHNEPEYAFYPNEKLKDNRDSAIMAICKDMYTYIGFNKQHQKRIYNLLAQNIADVICFGEM